MRTQTRGLPHPIGTCQQDGVGGEAAAKLGPLPEWSLADLYASPDAPEVTRDLEKAGAEARRIKESYHGKLAPLDAEGLAAAIEEFERLVAVMGRLGSFAGLHYAADQSDQVRAKFYGDISEKLTAISTDVIFFDLELNQIDDKRLEQALKLPRLARYKPWIENVRKEKPYQLE